MQNSRSKEIKALCEQKHKEFEELLPLNKESSWKLETSKDTFLVYSKKNKDLGLNYIRAEIELVGTPKQVIDILIDNKNYPNWDKSVERVDIIEKTDDYLITYNLTTPPSFFVSRRDFIIACSIKESSDGTMQWASASVNLESHPPVKGIVRAEMVTYGLKAVPISSTKTKVWMVMLIDIKGSIPKMVLNAACAEQAASLKKIKDMIEGKKKNKN
jgi:hypothetical protein